MSGDSKQMYNVIFVLGRPGAGKGTQCVQLEETFGYVHLSAGELLRVERQKTNSEYKEEIDKHFKNLTIVPVDITCLLLKQAMEESKQNCFLIDGFPRNQENFDGWHRVMDSVAVVRRVLVFDCPEEVCVERCLDRGKSGGTGRDDDNLETVKKRLKGYTDSTVPVIDHYTKQNLVTEINANQSPEEVFKNVKQAFDGFSSSWRD